jgi:putative restriction endonuclease
MARLATPLLNQSVIDAFEECNATVALISTPTKNPRRFVVQSGQNFFEVWVYIWTLTHGGGAARPKDEFRIQLTGVSPPLELNAAGPTVLIGYEPNLKCFAGFDINRHRRFSINSPSIQIPITVLHTALQHGFSFTKKGNNEIAIGIRPDQLLAYTLNAELLHTYGGEAKTVDLLTKAAALEPIKPDEMEKVAKDRQRIVATVSRLSRDVDFRRKVTIAYDRRCSVTRMQLRLIDAAHILPVGARGSNDEIYNGICLSPTYHRAFDRSLIYLDEDLHMRINPAQESELTRLGLNGGINDFKVFLNNKIHLPADRSQWPQLSLIQEANKFRGIQ